MPEDNLKAAYEAEDACFVLGQADRLIMQGTSSSGVGFSLASFLSEDGDFATTWLERVRTPLEYCL